MLPDQLDGIGPAAGILAAHQFAPDVAWLVMACDMPGIGRQEVQQLMAARNPAADATAFAPAPAGPPEPLCAIYEPGTLANFAARIAQGGSPSPKGWLASVRTHLILPASGRALASENTEE
jgi:molybdopterin-guanine dinucleotide biosynthesis protein A